MIGPTDLLHPSPAPHFKTFQVFLTAHLIRNNVIDHRVPLGGDYHKQPSQHSLRQRTINTNVCITSLQQLAALWFAKHVLESTPDIVRHSLGLTSAGNSEPPPPHSPNSCSSVQTSCTFCTQQGRPTTLPGTTNSVKNCRSCDKAVLLHTLSHN